MAPALDIILTHPLDPPHSELQELTRLLHQLLFDSILTEHAKEEYTAQLKNFQFPPGWPHLRNPCRHLGSYRLFEHARWSIIAPVLFRVWLDETKIIPHFATAIRQTLAGVISEVMHAFGLEVTISTAHVIFICFASVARSIMRLMSDSMTLDEHQSVAADILEARRCFKGLNEAAWHASIRNPRSCAQTPASAGGRPREGLAVESSNDSLTPTYLDPTTSATSNLSIKGLSQSDRITIRSEQYRQDQDRPKVHVGVLYKELLDEYGLMTHCNVLLGEGQDRRFKSEIYNTNYIIPERDLLRRLNFQMTVRFLIGGAFTNGDPLLSVQAVDVETESQQLAGDANHRNVAALTQIQRNYSGEALVLSSRGADMSQQDHRQVCDVYQTDYNRIVSILGSNLIKTLQQRLCFSRGEFVLIRASQICRIDDIFTHGSATGAIYAFVRVTTTEIDPVADPFTDLARLRITTKRNLVGVTAIGVRRLYTLPIVPDSTNHLELQLVPPASKLQAGSELLYVKKNIHFL
ncbi:hypothetical protein K3495_g12491 [Podosphaera aphanis]|nr:hypothetical protein K3495_g12491 [Podosphaera aphanis]